MAKDYVEERNRGLFIKDTRVSLDSVVYAFLRGESPEGTLEAFPALSLEQVFGALAFYMANRTEVDEYLRKGKEEFELLKQQSREENPGLYAKLTAAREKAHRPSR